MSNGGQTLRGQFLEVTGAFGYDDRQSLVVNEARKGEDRKLNGSVPRVVGFTIRNCVAEVENSLIEGVFEIPVRRWVASVGAGGVTTYTPVAHTVVLEPGQSEIFETCDFIAYMLNNKETHGLSLRNGVIKRSSRGGKKGGNVGDLSDLSVYTVDEASYFCFSFSPKCNLRLHDPEVKKNIGIKVDGVLKVKDEYKEYFGFLEMSGMNSRRVRKLVQQQVAERIRANYQMMAEQKAKK